MLGRIKSSRIVSPASHMLRDASIMSPCIYLRFSEIRHNHQRGFASINHNPVHWRPRNGISVVIEDGGVGGLMTALECWRIGCSVRVLERSRQNVTSGMQLVSRHHSLADIHIGDSFSIGPSAISSFKNWPLLSARNAEIAYDPLVSFHHINGERFAGPKDFSKMLCSEDADKVYRHSRPRFHSMLLEQLHHIGVEVEYGCEVHEYFEEAGHSRASVILRDGSQVSGDLVVAADGLRSKSWPLIAGKEVPARSSGDALFRVAYPVELALADTKVAEHFQLLEDGRLTIQLWRGAGVQAAFWRNQHEMSWSLSHPVSTLIPLTRCMTLVTDSCQDDGEARESWSSQVTPSDVIQYTSTIPGWPEIADRVIKTTPPGTRKLVSSCSSMPAEPKPS